ncbi:MAG: MATE family efflux transporter [Aristaeellaceae bacterium]
MNQPQSFLATERVGKLMGKYAVPCIISLLVGALYNIVDQIFIANADYLGSYGNAANTVVFPLTVIALAIAVMIGDGCCAFVSLSLGKHNPEEARRSMGNAILLTVIAGLLLTAIYLGFSDRIISMFGGTVNEETFRHSKEYFFWITLGIPFYMFGQAMNPVIRADGSPKFAMFSTLCGAVINIILDPVLIFACKWGMMGAAIATVLGQMVTAALAVWYLRRTRTGKLSRRDFRLNAAIVKRMTSLGVCSFLSQISLVAAMAAINNMIRKYGAMDPIFAQAQYAQIPMAVVGIVMKFFQIVISIVVGMAAGCIPIVGYNMGARLSSRVRKLFTRLLIAEACVGTVALVIVEAFPHGLIGIFGAANESVYYTEFSVRAFRIYLCMMIFACVNKAAFIFLQAMGKAVASTLISMVREIIFGVGFALILPHFFGLDGVLYSMPVSDALTAVISAVVIASTYRQLSAHPETGCPAPQPSST